MSSAREQVHLLLINPVLHACIFSWLSAQSVKTCIKLFSGKVHSIPELFELLLWRTGSMPSSHSAVVASLCTSIAFRDGVGSDMFILSVCFFFVVIRDAMGVRRASGIQATLLNRIGRALEERGIMEFRPIKEVQGHTPAEVAIGCLLGVFIGTAFSVFK